QQIEIKELLVEALITIPDEDFRFLMRYVVETYRSYDEPTVREIIRRVRPEEEENMMSMFAQDMIAKGERRGMQIGRQEGETALLLRQLQRRFGAVPTWAVEKITQADLPSLEEWSLRVLEAHSLEEMFSDSV
ncbi:MAG: DUF4351 domain-containing protein, partial [Magnetococcales bacterium]|nr:DUF4351 domain-containing protein [Magnetococcales bacterium]